MSGDSELCYDTDAAMQKVISETGLSEILVRVVLRKMWELEDQIPDGNPQIDMIGQLMEAFPGATREDVEAIDKAYLDYLMEIGIAVLCN